MTLSVEDGVVAPPVFELTKVIVPESLLVISAIDHPRWSAPELENVIVTVPDPGLAPIWHSHILRVFLLPTTAGSARSVHVPLPENVSDTLSIVYPPVVRCITSNTSIALADGLMLADVEVVEPSCSPP